MLYVCGEGLKGDVATPYSVGDTQERRLLQQFLPLEAPLLAIDDFVVQSKAMTSAGRQMKAYSRRKLTYDSDSLNAILGILDELSKDEAAPSYHIWGVPFASYERDYNDDTTSRRISYEIALNWYHHDPARRRQGFPSWSSIGWEGPIEYNYQDQPMAPDDIDVRVMATESYTTLNKYATSGLACKLSGLDEAPRRLLLSEARTIPIHTREFDGYICAVLKVAGNLDIYSWVHWDENMSASTQNLMGVIIYRNDQSKRLAMLLLSQRGDHYERVGFLMFDGDYLEWEKMSRGMIRLHGTDEKITDAHTLNQMLEQPIRFVDEGRQSIVLA